MTCTIDVFVVPPFQENTYLFSDLDAGAAIVVDPGGRVPEILAKAESRGVRIELIANTHAHIDHVLGIAELKAATGAPFRIHPDAAATLANVPDRAVSMGLAPQQVPEADGPLAAGDKIRFGTQTLTVRYTPGHAPGHTTFYAEQVAFEDGSRPLAFCGDVIFRGSIGRTDFEGGDYELLMTVITDQILTMPGDTVLLSGHGPATTVEEEARTNPFVLQWQRGS